MLVLALEIIAEVRPTNGKAKQKYNSLLRLVEGEKEVAWADQDSTEQQPQQQHTTSLLLPPSKQFLDTTEVNVSPAFLQSSGILTVSHADHVMVECVEDDVEEGSPLCVNETSKHLLSTTTLDQSPVCVTMSPRCHGNDVTPVFCHWTKKTPVAMAMDSDMNTEQ